MHPSAIFSARFLGLVFAAVGTALSTARGDQPSPTLSLETAVTQRCLSVLREAVRGEEFWPSMHAAEALSLSGHGEEVRELLTPLLARENDDQRRCGLARELVRAGDRGRAAVMLDILAGDDPYGHVHAAESLYKVSEIGDGRLLRNAMEQSANIKLQLMAAAALGRCGNPRAFTLLRDKLVDPDLETQRISAWILGRIGDSRDIAPLRANLDATEDPISRCYFVNALAALGDEGGLEMLAVNLSSDDPAIRTYSATFAGDARALATADRLIGLLEDENVDVRARAAQSLLLMSQPPPLERHRDISQLVYPADEKHPRWTEGSILELNDGSLLYAVTQFIDGGSDFSQAQIVARRSRDEGRSWEPYRVLQPSSGRMNVMSVTLRRLDRPHHRRIAMFYLEKNGYDDLQVYVRFSDDEAQTFGDPIRVTNEPGYHVMNNDRVVQLTSGRLLAPVATTPDVHQDNHFVSLCWLSDDGGTTWRKGRCQVDQPQRGAMEPAVIELNDGRVMMLVRTQLGYIATSESTDGGDTWSDPGRLTVTAPEAPATIQRIPATGELLLIWNNTFEPGSGHGGRRTPLTAAISADEGTTWQHVRNLEANPERTYSYTSLMFSRGRAVMSYWESQGDRLSSRFRSLPVSWFYAGSAAAGN